MYDLYPDRFVFMIRSSEGNNAEEESAHGEEKTDEDEGEHEASFEIVLVSPAITSS